MRDKSLDIFLVAFFGISGLVILIMAVVRPMPESERIFTTFIGSAGLFIALVRALLRKPLKAGTEAEQVMVEVEVEDKP
ncbi:hypothetical protein ACFLUO_06155 [Chloroflexota bacterium]